MRRRPVTDTTETAPSASATGRVMARGAVAALVGNRRVEPREFPVPPIGEDEILLGIGLTGVCGSDLHRFQDVQKTLDLDVPVVMGHEITGRVLALGSRANAAMKADGDLRE